VGMGGQSVRCEAPYFPGALEAIGLMWLLTLVILGFKGVYSHHAYPYTMLIFGGLLVFTVCGCVVKSRHAIRAIEFTETQVRCENRAGVRMVDTREVSAVRIEHSGDNASGYQDTWLRVEWRKGSRSISFGHDPALAQVLARLLPSHVDVEEQWAELHDPSTG
jgi:hypothetical protein